MGGPERGQSAVERLAEAKFAAPDQRDVFRQQTVPDTVSVDRARWCRSLVISRTPVARLPLDTYWGRLGNVEMRGPVAKRAVKQRGAKNGESENP